MATLSQEEQEALIVEHMKYAEKGAMAHLRRSGGKADRDELISAAYMGLVVAAKKFDPAKGFKFTTYSFHWIDQHLTRVYETNRRANGYAYSPDKSERAAGAKPNAMHQRLKRCDFPTYTDKNGETQEIGISSGQPNPETLLLYQEVLDEAGADQKKKVNQFLRRAQNSRDREIVRLVTSGVRAHAIAEQVGISRERVRQVVNGLGIDYLEWRQNGRASRTMQRQTPAEIAERASEMPRAAASEELRRRLSAMAVGDIVSHESLAQAIGRDLHDARGILTSVRKVLLEDERMVFASHRGLGLKRLDDSELIVIGTRQIKSAAGAARRGLRVLASVRDFEALPNDEKLKHNTALAQLGMLVHVTSETVVQRLENRIAQAQLPTQELLDAMKDSL